MTDVSRAVELVKDGLSVARAAEICGVPASTVRDHLHDSENDNSAPASSTSTRLLSVVEEYMFASSLVYLVEDGWELNRDSVRVLLRTFLAQLGRKKTVERTLNDKLAWHRWMSAFEAGWSGLSGKISQLPGQPTDEFLQLARDVLANSLVKMNEEKQQQQQQQQQQKQQRQRQQKQRHRRRRQSEDAEEEEEEMETEQQEAGSGSDRRNGESSVESARCRRTGGGSDLYEVERILAKRYNLSRKVDEYLIKWKFMDYGGNTWEPRDQLSQCAGGALLGRFERRWSSLSAGEKQQLIDDKGHGRLYDKLLGNSDATPSARRGKRRATSPPSSAAKSKGAHLKNNSDSRSRVESVGRRKRGRPPGGARADIESDLSEMDVPSAGFRDGDQYQASSRSVSRSKTRPVNRYSGAPLDASDSDSDCASDSSELAVTFAGYTPWHLVDTDHAAVCSSQPSPCRPSHLHRLPTPDPSATATAQLQQQQQEELRAECRAAVAARQQQLCRVRSGELQRARAELRERVLERRRVALRALTQAQMSEQRVLTHARQLRHQLQLLEERRQQLQQLQSQDTEDDSKLPSDLVQQQQQQTMEMTSDANDDLHHHHNHHHHQQQEEDHLAVASSDLLAAAAGGTGAEEEDEDDGETGRRRSRTRPRKPGHKPWLEAYRKRMEVPDNSVPARGRGRGRGAGAGRGSGRGRGRPPLIPRISSSSGGGGGGGGDFSFDSGGGGDGGDSDFAEAAPVPRKAGRGRRKRQRRLSEAAAAASPPPAVGVGVGDAAAVGPDGVREMSPYHQQQQLQASAGRRRVSECLSSSGKQRRGGRSGPPSSATAAPAGNTSSDLLSPDKHSLERGSVGSRWLNSSLGSTDGLHSSDDEDFQKENGKPVIMVLPPVVPQYEGAGAAGQCRSLELNTRWGAVRVSVVPKRRDRDGSLRELPKTVRKRVGLSVSQHVLQPVQVLTGVVKYVRAAPVFSLLATSGATPSLLCSPPPPPPATPLPPPPPAPTAAAVPVAGGGGGRVIAIGRRHLIRDTSGKSILATFVPSSSPSATSASATAVASGGGGSSVAAPRVSVVGAGGRGGVAPLVARVGASRSAAVVAASPRHQQLQAGVDRWSRPLVAVAGGAAGGGRVLTVRRPSSGRVVSVASGVASRGGALPPARITAAIAAPSPPLARPPATATAAASGGATRTVSIFEPLETGGARVLATAASSAQLPQLGSLEDELQLPVECAVSAGVAGVAPLQKSSSSSASSAHNSDLDMLAQICATESKHTPSDESAPPTTATTTGHTTPQVAGVRTTIATPQTIIGVNQQQTAYSCHAPAAAAAGAAGGGEVDAAAAAAAGGGEEDESATLTGTVDEHGHVRIVLADGTTVVADLGDMSAFDTAGLSGE